MPIAMGLLSAQPLDARPKVFGKNAPFALRDLPAGRFQRDLESLPRTSKRRALRWLHSFTFTAQDMRFLHVDRNGGIFYADTILPDDIAQNNSAQGEGVEDGVLSAPPV
ncbi:MAG: hypothetical protein ABFS02_01195 [Pseudomonadota bacterium]